MINVDSPAYGYGDISFSSNQKFIVTSFGCFEIGLDLSPTDNATNPLGVSQPAYYSTNDGWAFSTTTKQRMCWIPYECRGCWASNKNTIVLGSHEGHVTILDMRAINS